jgi:hypothetical protein
MAKIGRDPVERPVRPPEQQQQRRPATVNTFDHDMADD